MIRTGPEKLAYSVMHVIIMLSCRQEVRSEVKWPRAQTPVKGELRPLRLTAIVAAFERRLMPILQSFTFGNANVTINPKKKSFITIESSVFQVTLPQVVDTCTQVYSGFHAATNGSLQSLKRTNTHLSLFFTFLFHSQEARSPL